MEPEVRETIDYIAIRRLQDAYADVVNRRAWPELGELFRPEAEVVLDVRRGELLVVHRARARSVTSSVGRSSASSSSSSSCSGPGSPSIRTTPIARRRGCTCASCARASEEGRHSVAYGVYHDEHVRFDGRWWFARRRYHSLARTAPDLAVFPFPDVTREAR